MELEHLYSNIPPQFLFHYTSATGMLGILSSGSIWATEARYLNDAKELSNTLDFVIYEVVQRLGSTDPEEFEVLKQFESWLRDRVSSGHAIFVVSLTENGNLLSQWRGYTPPNTGVSIGFDAARLKTMAAAVGFRLGRCIYDINEQSEIVRGLLNEILVGAKRCGPAPANVKGPSQSYYQLFEDLEEKIFLGAALLKHHSFKEEAEWRLVSSLVQQYRDAPIKFRLGASCLVPFLTFNLRDEDGGLTVVRRAFVGPTPNPNLAMHAVTIALAQYVKGSHVIVNSMLPLRQV